MSTLVLFFSSYEKLSILTLDADHLISKQSLFKLEMFKSRFGLSQMF